jgi:hypothetical protein
MLRIYARVLAAALVAVAVLTAAVGTPGWGFGAGAAAYLGSAAVFAYTGFWRGEARMVRSVVAGLGSLFLVSGLLVALAMGVLGFPLGGRLWEAGLAHAASGELTMACAALLPCEDEE